MFAQAGESASWQVLAAALCGEAGREARPPHLPGPLTISRARTKVALVIPRAVRPTVRQPFFNLSESFVSR